MALYGGLLSRVATEGLRQSGDRPGARSIKADDNRRLSVWIPTQPDRYDTGDRKQASLILCFYFLDGHYRPLQAKPKRRKTCSMRLMMVQDR